MTKAEFIKLAAAIKTLWPKDTKTLVDEIGLSLWFEILKDLPYTETSRAITRLAMTSVFCPSIAEIRQEVAKELNPDHSDGWSDAWGKVLKAISHFGMYQEKEALDSLDNLARTAVERMGWNNICLSENIAVERANFREIYKDAEERAKIRMQIGLPGGNMQMISNAEGGAIDERKN